MRGEKHKIVHCCCMSEIWIYCPSEEYIVESIIPHLRAIKCHAESVHLFNSLEHSLMIVFLIEKWERNLLIFLHVTQGHERTLNIIRQQPLTPLHPSFLYLLQCFHTSTLCPNLADSFGACHSLSIPGVWQEIIHVFMTPWGEDLSLLVLFKDLRFTLCLLAVTKRKKEGEIKHFQQEFCSIWPSLSFARTFYLFIFLL